jgi:hypothetical protein
MGSGDNKCMNSTQATLRDEVRQLAEEAFHLKLISGYGDGADVNEYQIVYQGKPRHLPLEQARFFLINLIYRNQIHSLG